MASKTFQRIVQAVLIVQLAGCGTIMYPQRRGQPPNGRVDPGVAFLDTLGLVFFIVPGVIAFAVDISDGCLYLPARPWPRRAPPPSYAPPPPGYAPAPSGYPPPGYAPAPGGYSPQPGYGPGGYPPPPPPLDQLQGMNILRLRLQPGHEDAAAIEKLIRRETGLAVSFKDPALQARRLHSIQEMADDFAAFSNGAVAENPAAPAGVLR